MVELRYWLFIIFMIPYMLVIAKMLLHFISSIAYKIAKSICDKKLSDLNANPDIKTEDRYEQGKKKLQEYKTFSIILMTGLHIIYVFQTYIGGLFIVVFLVLLVYFLFCYSLVLEVA